MNEKSMLHDMCRTFLTNPDIKAICKNRGFSAREAKTRLIFENFFLTETGVATSLATLTNDEIAILHVLKSIGKPEKVSVFSRVYGDKKPKGGFYYLTFNQRYQDVFKKVKKNLVRKGLLLIAEKKTGGDTKLERLRFMLPEKFGALLPLPFEPMIVEKTKELQKDVVRQKMMAVAGSGGLSTKLNPLYVQDGALRLHKKDFRLSALKTWLRDSWVKEIDITGVMLRKSLVESTIYLLSLLGPNQWAEPDTISRLFKVFVEDLNKPVDDNIFEIGWKWGRLKKCRRKGKTYYRLPDEDVVKEAAPETWLAAEGDGPVIIDLAKAPPENLDLFGRISDMEVRDSKLTALPNIKKLGRYWSAVSGRPFIRWLKERSPAFKKGVGTASRRIGKTLIHRNLMIARVKDLSLKVKIEKTFHGEGQIVTLPDDYIAFSPDLLGDMQKLVKKSGHVVKWVEGK